MSAPKYHSILEDLTPESTNYYDDRRLMYRNGFWYLFGVSAGGFGFSTVQSMMPMHMAKIGMDSESISFALSIRSWVYMILVLYIAHVSDHWQGRWGRRLPFLALSLPFLIAGMLFFPLITSHQIIIVVFAIFSLFVGLKYDTYPLLSYDLFRHKYWGRIAGIGGLTAGFAIWVGQTFLMPMSDKHGEEFVYILAACFLLFSTILTLVFVKEPPLRAARPPQWNPLLVIIATLRVGFAKPRNPLLFLGFVLIISPTLALNFLSVQSQVNLGLTQGEVGKDILQWGTLGGMMIAPFMGLGVDRFGAVRTCFFGCMCCIAACYFGFHPRTTHELAIASVLITVAGGTIYSAATIFVASGIERENIATFCACNGAVCHAVTAVLLPICGILIKNAFGGNYGSIFLIVTILTIAGLVILVWLDQKRRRIESALHIDVQLLPLIDAGI